MATSPKASVELDVLDDEEVEEPREDAKEDDSPQDSPQPSSLSSGPHFLEGLSDSDEATPEDELNPDNYWKDRELDTHVVVVAGDLRPIGVGNEFFKCAS